MSNSRTIEARSWMTSCLGLWTRTVAQYLLGWASMLPTTWMKEGKRQGSINIRQLMEFAQERLVSDARMKLLINVKHTAAIEGFFPSPAGGCVTSAPKKITGCWNTDGLLRKKDNDFINNYFNICINTCCICLPAKRLLAGNSYLFSVQVVCFNTLFEKRKILCN